MVCGGSPGEAHRAPGAAGAGAAAVRALPSEGSSALRPGSAARAGRELVLDFCGTVGNHTEAKTFKS